MSTVIKQVDSEFIEKKHKAVKCNSCGYGLGVDDPNHFNYKEHMAMDGKQCDCGGTYGLTEVTFTHTTPSYTLVKCDCGEKVACSGFTTTCSCGRDYNWNGDQLAPRSQWGEETGESIADIMGVDDYDF